MGIYYNGHHQANIGGGSSGGGGGIDYSTTEQNTGLKWIDGKDIYQKTFNLTFSSSHFTTVDLTALNVDNVMSIEGGVCDSAGGFIPFGYESAVSVYTASSTTLGINNTYYSSRTSGYATIRYTKTTDTPNS